MYSAGIESFITLQSVWSIWPANASFAGVSKSPRNETAGGSRLYHTTSFSGNHFLMQELSQPWLEQCLSSLLLLPISFLCQAWPLVFFRYGWVRAYLQSCSGCGWRRTVKLCPSTSRRRWLGVFRVEIGRVGVVLLWFFWQVFNHTVVFKADDNVWTVSFGDNEEALVRSLLSKAGLEAGLV